MYREKGHFKKVRNSIVMLTIDPDINADELLQLAVDKHCACDCLLDLVNPIATAREFVNKSDGRQLVFGDYELGPSCLPCRRLLVFHVY